MALATTHVLNVAHGNFLVLGAALATLLLNILKLGAAATLAAIVACFAVAGLPFARVFVRPLLGKTPEQILIGSILITFGFGLSSEALLGYYWARWVDPQPSFSITFPWARLDLGGVTLSGTRLFILVMAAGLIAAFHLFLTRSRLGKAIRAMAQNYEAAVILGMNPRQISTIVYLLGIVATAISGVLLILAAPLRCLGGGCGGRDGRPGAGLSAPPSRGHARFDHGGLLHVPVPGPGPELRYPGRIHGLHEPGPGGVFRSGRVPGRAPSEHRLVGPPGARGYPAGHRRGRGGHRAGGVRLRPSPLPAERGLLRHGHLRGGPADPLSHPKLPGRDGGLLRRLREPAALPGPLPGLLSGPGPAVRLGRVEPGHRPG